MVLQEYHSAQEQTRIKKFSDAKTHSKESQTNVINLQRLPQMSVHSYICRFLEVAKLLLPVKEYDKLKINLVSFLRSPSAKMICLYLKISASLDSNWANKFWLADMYTKCRYSLVSYSNPAYIVSRRLKCCKNADDLIWLMSCVCYSLLKISKDIYRHNIKQEKNANVHGQFHLCMKQYHVLFHSYRIPKHNQDQCTTANKYQRLEDIVVIFRGHVCYLSS
ncbi:hypothetical protein GJ496_007541 [Pomphorhynchus laevis]|nr:hypothetical protein GJ496_007541 [Pomphorhynchus laevis]